MSELKLRPPVLGQFFRKLWKSCPPTAHMPSVACGLKVTHAGIYGNHPNAEIGDSRHFIASGQPFLRLVARLGLLALGVCMRFIGAVLAVAVLALPLFAGQQPGEQEKPKQEQTKKPAPQGQEKGNADAQKPSEQTPAGEKKAEEKAGTPKDIEKQSKDTGKQPKDSEKKQRHTRPQPPPSQQPSRAYQSAQGRPGSRLLPNSAEA